MYDEYIKYAKFMGCPVILSKNKLGQVITQLFDRPDIHIRRIAGEKVYCYIDLTFQINGQRYQGPPVTQIYNHFTTLTEHEIVITSIPTVYLKNHIDQQFKFVISKETGLIHLYFGGIHIDMDNFRLHDQFLQSDLH